MDEVHIPEDLPKALHIDLPIGWRIMDWINLLLAIGGFGLLAVFLCSHRERWVHLTYVLTWLGHVVLFYTALLLNRYGFFTIEYSDIFFLKWSILLRFHILLAGVLMVVYRLWEDRRLGR